MEVLIKDPGGVIHRVRSGEYMGQNYGHITAISEDHIDLVELVSNGNGGWMERPASIALAAQ
jgi:type IV pilus assembly protein PilP